MSSSFVNDFLIRQMPEPETVDDFLIRQGKEKGPEVVKEPVNLIDHPPHYNASSIEPIDVIEAWDLGFCLGNTVKYIARAPHKGTEIQDLEKARWYLDRQIKRLKNER